LRPNGFTLIEVMVAVVLIGVLALIAVFNYQRNVDRTREGSVVAVAHSFHLATESFLITHGFYPGTPDVFYPEMFGGNIFPKNPFTGRRIDVGTTGSFSRGNIGYSFDATTGKYRIEGYGANERSGPLENGVVVALSNG